MVISTLGSNCSESYRWRGHFSRHGEVFGEWEEDRRSSSQRNEAIDDIGRLLLKQNKKDER